MIALTKTDKLTSAEKGTWSQHEGHVLMSCPMCGKLGRLDDHKIAENGLVSPSVVCPVESCSFHDTVKLLGWTS